MTIEGAIAELQNLINADDVPFYYDGVIKKVIETIIDECKPNTDRRVKFYEMPNGKTAIFEFDENGVGQITVETMDRMMELINSYGGRNEDFDPYQGERDRDENGEIY